MTTEARTGRSAIPGELFFAEFLGILSEARWLIAIIILVALIVGVLHAYLATPIYSADALVRIESESLGVVNLEGFGGFKELFDSNAIQHEMEVIRSRRVLSEVVHAHNLDVIARPVYMPIIGKAVARYSTKGQVLAEPWFGTDRYAWGGEKLTVELFDVPKDYLWQPFTLVAEGKVDLALFDEEGSLVGHFQAGTPAEFTISDSQKIKVTVSEISARKGTHFELVKIPLLAAIDNLKENLEIERVGGDNDQVIMDRSGILKVGFYGENKYQITNILNDVIESYEKRKSDMDTARAETTSKLLAEQLLVVKKRLTAAENEYNSYRREKGSVDLDLETKAVLDRIVAMESSVVELKQTRYELLQSFTPSHPKVKTLDSQIGDEIKRLRSLEDKVRKLPDTQQKALQLSKNVEVNNQIYMTLLDKVNELDVVRAGTIGNIVIIDKAEVPYEAIKPKKNRIIAAYIFLGTLLSLGVAITRDALFGGVKDPDIIEKELGLPVYAIIPYSKNQRTMKETPRPGSATPSILSVENPGDPAIESLRSLRTSMHFALLEAKNNIVTITSPGPNDGKSFVSINFGVVLAKGGKRVLVIDCDMRKGHLHRIFGEKRGRGLADLIASNDAVDECIRGTPVNNLYILTTGVIPPNPSELLLHDNFAVILNHASQMFDYVLIDTPPILAVTDSATVSSLAGATFLVVKSGSHPVREIGQCIKRLKQARANVRGIVFNGIQTAVSGMGYGRYYGHHYKYKTKQS